ncbi:DMT family transporter [Silvimonas amylolytica]|nr:DMT family transporter [Silvimonas amylolytica]
MSPARVFAFTLFAMVAFAGNSILCRLALKNTPIDPASFTMIRIVSGAAVLALLVSLRKQQPRFKGNVASSWALFIYAAGFSYAYVNLPAAAGALILFGAVQISMIGYGLWRGERLAPIQWLGVLLAAAGVIGLMLPGLSAPPLLSSILMIAAGVAWGVYSLRGRGAGDPTAVTAGNFLLAIPAAVGCWIIVLQHTHMDAVGVMYALASGVITSGLGYALWYRVLPALAATSAAIVQLSVPAIAAIGAVLFLNEPLGLRLILASVAILGGIVLVILNRRAAA